ncbi:MAG: hypothetical protein R3E46_14665 [Sedimenticolaceae bacterium]
MSSHLAAQRADLYATHCGMGSDADGDAAWASACNNCSAGLGALSLPASSGGSSLRNMKPGVRTRSSPRA